MSDREELIKLISTAPAGHGGSLSEAIADHILDSNWFKRATSVTGAAGRQMRSNMLVCATCFEVIGKFEEVDGNQHARCLARR